VTFRGEAVPVVPLTDSVFRDIDVAFFSAGASRSREAGPAAVRAGATVIDNSSAFRMHPEIPLVVPEVNAEAADGHPGLIANPNCSTIILAVALAPIHRRVPVRSAVVATYQAVSGAGARALAELEEQRAAAARGEEPRAFVFPAPIDGNVLPQIGPLDESGISEEEAKMERELRKILGDGALAVSATCARVPVPRTHCEAVHLELVGGLSAEEALALLRDAPGVELTTPELATPLEASGRNDVLVSRVRNAPGRTDALSLWIAGDQLLKGAALNAVQIAESLVDRGLLPRGAGTPLKGLQEWM